MTEVSVVFLIPSREEGHDCSLPYSFQFIIHFYSIIRRYAVRFTAIFFKLSTHC
jgi:hypothetical protein